MTINTQAYGDSFANYGDDELALLVTAASERMTRLETQIIEEPSATLALMMREVLAEARSAFEQLRAEQVLRNARRSPTG